MFRILSLMFAVVLRWGLLRLLCVSDVVFVRVCVVCFHVGFAPSVMRMCCCCSSRVGRC